MPSPPLRFLHAANASLDSVVWLPGELTDAVRETAATATRTAFRNVIRECLRLDVEFLLLCGNTFQEDSRSLTARVVLRDGLRELDAAGIPVFVLPGTDDPADAWRAIPALPDNVTILDDDSAVEVTRDDVAIAIIKREHGNAEESQGSASGPIRIAVQTTDGCLHGPSSAFDYTALGGPATADSPHKSNGTAHHPGLPQPLSPAGTNGSCTLVEFDESRTCRLTPLPTAPIRFEHLKKTLDAGDTPRDLLHTLPGQLALRPATDGETLRCVLWTLDGDGPLWDALQSPASRRDVEAELASIVGEDAPTLVHRMEPFRTSDAASACDGLAGDFQHALASAIDTAPFDVKQGLCELAARRAEWRPRLEQLAGRLSANAVVAKAEHIGRQRLLPTTPEGLEA